VSNLQSYSLLIALKYFCFYFLLIIHFHKCARARARVCVCVCVCVYVCIIYVIRRCIPYESAVYWARIHAVLLSPNDCADQSSLRENYACINADRLIMINVVLDTVLNMVLWVFSNDLIKKSDSTMICIKRVVKNSQWRNNFV